MKNLKAEKVVILSEQELRKIMHKELFEITRYKALDIRSFGEYEKSAVRRQLKAKLGGYRGKMSQLSAGELVGLFNRLDEI